MPTRLRRGFALAALAIACGVYFALAIVVLVACTGGAGSTTPMPMRVDYPLPAFTAYSSDLVAFNEGTIGNPLKVANNPRCVLEPIWALQTQLCTGSVPEVFTSSNHVATTNDWHRWRAVVNVENSWDTACVTGPPNQSLPINQAPITWEPKATGVTYGFELPNEAAYCSKIPYVAATYIRGVQGDPAPGVAEWGAQPVLTFTTRIDRTVGPTFAQSVYWWAHFKTPDGARWMPSFTLWDSGFMPADASFRWNWPALNSYYFPGANMHIGKPCGGVVEEPIADGLTRWVIDIEALARCRFPELAAQRPVFQGFELATEGTYLDFAHPTGLPNRMRLTLSSPTLTLLRRP